MRVPHELLRDTVSVEDYGGAAAHGPIYGQPRSVKAQMQPTSKLATDLRGQTVGIDVLAIVRPESGPVRPESRVTSRGETYRVVQSFPMPDERRPSHWELQLARLARASSGTGSGS